jgi:YD repeat-containing protein
LWTTDPNNAAVGASYILADSTGKISLQVQSSDPDNLTGATATTYTQLQTVYDSSGNVVSQYLQIVLHSSSAGNWNLTAQGASSQNSQVFNFSITQ